MVVFELLQINVHENPQEIGEEPMRIADPNLDYSYNFLFPCC